jgi:hypothetical protein
VVHLQVVSLSLVLLSLSICPHLTVLRNTLKMIEEFNVTSISYHPLVIRNSLPVFVCGLVVCDYVVLTLSICYAHVCFIDHNVLCLSFVFV